MQQSVFVSYILILTLAMMQIYSRARETFNGVSEYRAEIERLRQEDKRQRLAVELERENFLEFRQSVAALMPEVLKTKGEGEQGYPIRSLASVITRSESDKVRGVIAKTLFESGKAAFSKKEYSRAKRAFRELINRYSYTPYVTESYFLLAESHFQENELEECVQVVQQMVDLFPSAELTGFALIRLGRVYEMQSRSDEAVEIYRTVIRSFPQRDVVVQARSSLKGMAE